DLTGWLTDGDVPLARTFPGPRSWLTCLAVSPDGRLLAAGCDHGTVRVWDAADGRDVHSFEGGKGRVERITFSPAGRLLATPGIDGRVQLRDVQTGRPVRAVRGRKAIFSPDGRHIATAGDDLRVWNASTGQQLRRFPRRAFAVAYSPDGALLAAW